MFTGIVTAIGTIRQTAADSEGLQLTISCSFPDLQPGESVAVDGACLTVQSLVPGGFTAYVVQTTQERTRIGNYAPGQRVNLERALRAGDRLGGHIVQGHVDGIAEVERVEERAGGRLLDLKVSESVDQVSVLLGSITVDGVSLTVNSKPRPGVVQISLIPFTLQHTTLGERRVGDRVHIEADTIGKYVWSYLQNVKVES
ncbi:MAG TPA: riboflavin synthase [Gemmatimonadales bacterium]|nr:riboflavin synthase [Gemmatimonadales bacterium]